MSVRSAYAIYGKAAAPVTGSGRSHGDRDASPYGRGSAGVWGLADSILGSAVQRITSERNHESPAPPAQGSGRSMSGPTNPRLKRFSAASDHSAASAELQDGRGALSRSPSASNSSAALTSGSTPMTGRMALSGRPASGGQFASHTSSPISIQNLQLGAYASSKVVRPRSSGHTPIIEPKSPTSASRTGHAAGSPVMSLRDKLTVLQKANRALEEDLASARQAASKAQQEQAATSQQLQSQLQGQQAQLQAQQAQLQVQLQQQSEQAALQIATLGEQLAAQASQHLHDLAKSEEHIKMLVIQLADANALAKDLTMRNAKLQDEHAMLHQKVAELEAAAVEAAAAASAAAAAASTAASAIASAAESPAPGPRTPTPTATGRAAASDLAMESVASESDGLVSEHRISAEADTDSPEGTDVAGDVACSTESMLSGSDAASSSSSPSMASSMSLSVSATSAGSAGEAALPAATESAAAVCVSLLPAFEREVQVAESAVESNSGALFEPAATLEPPAGGVLSAGDGVLASDPPLKASSLRVLPSMPEGTASQQYHSPRGRLASESSTGATGAAAADQGGHASSTLHGPMSQVGTAYVRAASLTGELSGRLASFSEDTWAVSPYTHHRHSEPQPHGLHHPHAVGALSGAAPTAGWHPQGGSPTGLGGPALGSIFRDKERWSASSFGDLASPTGPALHSITAMVPNVGSCAAGEDAARDAPADADSAAAAGAAGQSAPSSAAAVSGGDSEAQATTISSMPASARALLQQQQDMLRKYQCQVQQKESAYLFLQAEHSELEAQLKECEAQKREYAARLAFMQLDTDLDGHIQASQVASYDMFACYSPMVLEYAMKHWRYASGFAGFLNLEDFMRFVTLADERSSKDALRWWHSILDLDGDGYIGVEDAKWFYDAADKGDAAFVIGFEDLWNQLVDMTRPKDARKGLTLSDLSRSGLGAGATGLLLNHNNMMLQRTTAEWGRGDFPL